MKYESKQWTISGGPRTLFCVACNEPVVTIVSGDLRANTQVLCSDCRHRGGSTMNKDALKEARARLSWLIDACLFPRGVGRTHTMLHGALNSEAVVVVPSMEFARALGLRRAVPHYEISQKLPGTPHPVVFDHYALALALGEVDRHLDKVLGTELGQTGAK